MGQHEPHKRHAILSRALKNSTQKERLSREAVKRNSAAAGAQGNAEMVTKIIKRGVHSLENNQAVIDREAWFKARPRCLHAMLMLEIAKVCPCACWAPFLQAVAHTLGITSASFMFLVCESYRRWPSPSAVRPGAGW